MVETLLKVSNMQCRFDAFNTDPTIFQLVLRLNQEFDLCYLENLL